MTNPKISERHFVIEDTQYHLRLIPTKYELFRYRGRICQIRGIVEYDGRRLGRFERLVDRTDPEVDYDNLTIILNKDNPPKKIIIREVCTDDNGKEILQKEALEKRAGLFAGWRKIKSFYELEKQR